MSISLSVLAKTKKSTGAIISDFSDKLAQPNFMIKLKCMQSNGNYYSIVGDYLLQEYNYQGTGYPM